MFFYLFIFIIISLIVLILFFSTRILVISEKNENIFHHRFELGLLLNTVGLQLALENSQKKIQIRFGKWKILSKKIISKKPKIKKEISEKEKKKETLGEKVRNLSSWPSLQLSTLKNHLIYIVKSFRNSKINGNLKLGFANPMHTGLIFGSFSMIKEFWTNLQKDIVFQPVFTKPVANWQIVFSSDFILARLIWKVLLIWNVFRKIKK